MSSNQELYGLLKQLDDGKEEEKFQAFRQIKTDGFKFGDIADYVSQWGFAQQCTEPDRVLVFLRRMDVDEHANQLTSSLKNLKRLGFSFGKVAAHIMASATPNETDQLREQLSQYATANQALAETNQLLSRENDELRRIHAAREASRTRRVRRRASRETRQRQRTEEVHVMPESRSSPSYAWMVWGAAALAVTGLGTWAGVGIYRHWAKGEQLEAGIRQSIPPLDTNLSLKNVDWNRVRDDLHHRDVVLQQNDELIKTRESQLDDAESAPIAVEKGTSSSITGTLKRWVGNSSPQEQAAYAKYHTAEKQKEKQVAESQRLLEEAKRNASTLVNAVNDKSAYPVVMAHASLGQDGETINIDNVIETRSINTLMAFRAMGEVIQVRINATQYTQFAPTSSDDYLATDCTKITYNRIEKGPNGLVVYATEYADMGTCSNAYKIVYGKLSLN